MQNTVMDKIQKGLAAFPNESLEEWILDYPLQVIITSLHLIVTHEIYEMIRLLKKFK
jgi:hypothetical protein